MRKKLFAALLIAACCSSCSNEVEKSNIERYAESLVTEFPNYATNELARESLNGAIGTHFKAMLGSEPTEIKGVAFRFEEIAKKGQELGVVFSSRSFLIGDVDADVTVSVFGVLDEQTASKLDKTKRYFVSGTLKEWDKEHFYLRGGDTGTTIDCGTLYLEPMSIQEKDAEE